MESLKEYIGEKNFLEDDFLLEEYNINIVSDADILQSALDNIYEHLEENREKYLGLIRGLKKFENQLRMIKQKKLLPNVTELIIIVTALIEEEKDLLKQIKKLI